jgi:two-component sensor histidine kinase
MDQRQEIELPAATAIPLGFIANELITNAAKYGTGRIMVRLEPNPEKGYALSLRRARHPNHDRAAARARTAIRNSLRPDLAG